MFSTRAHFEIPSAKSDWNSFLCGCFLGALAAGVFALSDTRHRGRLIMNLVPVGRACCFNASWPARLSSPELVSVVVQRLQLQARWQCSDEKAAVTRLRAMLRFPDGEHRTDSLGHREEPRPFRVDAYSDNQDEPAEILNALADEFTAKHAVLAEEARHTIIAVIKSKLDEARSRISVSHSSSEGNNRAEILALHGKIAELQSQLESIQSGKTVVCGVPPGILVRASADSRLYRPNAVKQILSGCIFGAAAGLGRIALRRFRHRNSCCPAA